MRRKACRGAVIPAAAAVCSPSSDSPSRAEAPANPVPTPQVTKPKPREAAKRPQSHRVGGGDQVGCAHLFAEPHSKAPGCGSLPRSLWATANLGKRAGLSSPRPARGAASLGGTSARGAAGLQAGLQVSPAQNGAGLGVPARVWANGRA